MILSIKPELQEKLDELLKLFSTMNPTESLEQVSFLIFLKRLEEDNNKKANDALLEEKYFVSVFKDNENCKWSKWTEMPAERMLEHVRDKVFPFLRKLNGGEQSVYSKYMKDASFTIPTASLLAEAVKIINDMHIKEQNRDTKGDLYEYLLSQLQTAGKNGQFRSPRHIIRMMVEILEPRYGEKICDPACGTAGFLIVAYEYILEFNTAKDLVKAGYLAGDHLNENQWRILREETFYGYDFDQTMTRISLMNLMMHGINNPNIEQKNTLSKRYDESNCYDVILANPPFKGSIDESEIGENFRTKTKKTELLFLELMYNLLTNSGRCAVIVPDGVLFGNSKAHKNIRQLLLEKCRLDAVISMPSGVFKPYAGVSTAVLFFTKGEPTKEVWFYDMESDGFSLDDKRTPQPDKNDIPDIIEKFKNRSKEKPADRKRKCFFVPITEIKQNNYDLSISKYKEIEYEEVEYEKPAVIKKKILEYENKIIEALNELKL